MKLLKIVGISFLSIFVAIFVISYLAFLFVLPNAVNLNKYSPKLTHFIQEETGFQVEIKGLKVKTAWNFSAGALIDKVDLKYPGGTKFAQINNLQIRFSLINLLRKKIRIDKVTANKVLLNLDMDNNGEFILNKYLNDNTQKPLPFGLTYSYKMPKILIEKYRVSFIENNNSNKYTVKGSDLDVSDFVLNKKIKLKTNGHVILNSREQIAYNLSIFSNVFPKSTKKTTNLIKIFEDLYKYNINADIATDLKVFNDSNIDGKIDISKISFTFANKIYPQSTLKLDFNGDKAKINSSLHVDKNSKVIISGLFKNGKDKNINLQVISDEINIKDVLLIYKAMSRPFGINNLKDFDANGLLKADFSIKSNFKKVESSGYLKIKEASLTNKLYNVLLNSINADVDFSQNYIDIRKASAKLNQQPIDIKGNIDKNAFANISILAKNLQLKGFLLAVGQSKILKENNVLAGVVNVKALLKGRLDKANPKINVVINNINLKNKQSKTQVLLKQAIINSNLNKDTKGTAQFSDLKIIPNPESLISIPKLSVLLNDKELNLEKTYLYINNARANLSGKISGINSNPKLNTLDITIPNQISVPIKGYKGANALVKGEIKLSGPINNPQINGNLIIPSIRIPTDSTFMKNVRLQLGNQITLDCPQIQIANSSMNLNTHIDKDFSNGIVMRNLKFNADNIDLNTIMPILKNLPNNQNSSLTIASGKSNIQKLKIGGIVSNGITSNIEYKNNILYLPHVRGNAYLGKIGGNISYDFNANKTNVQLQGRGLSANSALVALMGRNDDINGVLDFDSNVSIIGHSRREMLNSLKGYTNFIISNGKMGVLGKFEHLIYAQNILSNSIFKATLNVIAKAVTVKNTGVYKYMEGKINFSNGWANINWVKTSGPSMSLYLTGRYYLPDNTASLILLGRISDDVVNILGPLGEFSMDKAISYIPNIGDITTFLANQFTTNPVYENTSQIPNLTPKTDFSTKEFKVVIDGDIQKQSSVKSFKWLSRPKIKKHQNQQPLIQKKQASSIPDFVNKLPDYKN